MNFIRGVFPGTLLCIVIAFAATFISEHYGGPQLLYALLIGLALHYLSHDAKVKTGIDFCSRTVLRCGVALLGARITLPHIAELGVRSALLVVAGVVVTILCGVVLARLLKRPREEGLISGGAVAICGASAALAISAALPQTRENERYTLLTVVGVTVLSTIAMIVYPFIAHELNLSAVNTGIFFGATIHDVAQVVAAGLIVSPQAADSATVVKLSRVLLLVPVVLMLTVLYRSSTAAQSGGKRQPLVPFFLIAFIAFCVIASMGWLPKEAIDFASNASRAMLVTAIAAVGIKTSFQELSLLGWKPIAMLVGETLLLGVMVLVVLLVW